MLKSTFETSGDRINQKDSDWLVIPIEEDQQVKKGQGEMDPTDTSVYLLLKRLKTLNSKDSGKIYKFPLPG